MLVAYKCENCGGSINPTTLKCEYCGTQYERKIDNGVMHYIQTCPAKVQTLRSQIKISDNELRNIPPEVMAEHTMKVLTRNLADVLAQYTKIETMRDIETNTQIIRGTIRVVEPDFRF